MIGIIYKFTLIEEYELNGHKPFYIGQHWEKRSVSEFISSETYYYSGGGSIWNLYLKSLKRKHPDNWKSFIKREVLYSSEEITQRGLNGLEKFYIRKYKSLYSEKLGGTNIIEGASIEINPASCDIVRKKISLSLIGRKFSKQHINNLKKYWTSERLSGEKNPNYGHKWTQEMKDKMRAVKLGKYIGEKNPNYGHKWSDDKKKELSKRVKERFKTKPNPMSGKKRITNGEINTVIGSNEPLPDGFWFGMKKRKYESKED